MSSTDELRALVASLDHGVLVTIKSDGRPQLSNVNHTFDPATGLLRVSVTADRAKTRNLTRDPRASYHVVSADFWHYAVAEGTVELTPVAADPHDATVDQGWSSGSPSSTSTASPEPALPDRDSRRLS